MTFKRTFSTTAPRKMDNEMVGALASVNPNELQNLPLVDIAGLILVLTGSAYFLSCLFLGDINSALDFSEIMTAQTVEVGDMILDIFDKDDADIPQAIREWDHQRYGTDDWHQVPDTRQLIDTLPHASAPIDNLATVIESYSNRLIPRFDNMAANLEAAMEEFRFRSPTLNLEDRGYIRQLWNNLENINENLRVTGRTLHPLMDRTDVGSVFWNNHAPLRPSFERIHSQSDLLMQAVNRFFPVSVRAINFLRGLLNGGNNTNL